MANISALPFLPAPSGPAIAAPARGKSSPYPEIFQQIRKFAQGAGSAVLVFTGSGSMSEGAAQDALTAADPASIDGWLTAILNSDYAGPAQIIAAIFLFITAGQSIARFIGFGVAAIAIFMWWQGISPQDLWAMTGNLAQRFGAAAEAFQTAEIG